MVVMTEEVKSKGVIIFCPRCKRERKHYAKGLCECCHKYLWRLEKFKNPPLIKCACKPECPVIIPAWDSQGQPRKYEIGHWGFLNAGNKNGQYKKGLIETSSGYYEYLFHGHPFASKIGYIMVHRITYELFHKCCLLPWADVHHRDGNIKRNHPENLQGMLHGVHMTLTQIERWKKKKEN